MKPITDKTVAKTPARGARTKGAFPRYVTIGNAKRVARTVDVGYFVPEIGPGRLMADFGENGKWIGVEIME